MVRGRRVKGCSEPVLPHAAGRRAHSRPAKRRLGEPGTIPASLPPLHAADRPVVVVADDDQTLRSFFQAALQREGFDVLLASHGRRAIELARDYAASVLVVDLHMPGLDGLETIRGVRADAGLRTLPIILITASTEEADHVAGLDRGADDVVVKPVSSAELGARVRAQLRRRAAMTDELEAERQHRRRVAALLPELPRDAPLLTLATIVADRLPAILDVDGVAIIAFEDDGARGIAASPTLADRFRPARLLPAGEGAATVQQAETGPWLVTPARSGKRAGATPELAFVPFSLAAATRPIGCFVFAVRPSAGATRLSHRLADLMDTTDLIVSALRPAIEHAETTNAAILGLRGMIRDRAFTTVLQPIVRLEEGAVVAVEALTRFPDGARPDQRFSEASRLGLGLALERATLAGAIEAAAPQPPNVALSVNVSPDVLSEDDTLADLLAGAGRPVIVELTEHERIDDYAGVRAAIARLGPNVQLAVDDAGSGYASLRHILALQPAFVKLDMEWVRGIDRDPIRRSLVSGLTYFAVETGCELIAEGIETPQERTALLELGVRLGQGFLLGYPRAVGTSDPA
ncbi:MAG TPA: EAL domain-containing protein [Candidatus Limnocylindrales bacterium]|nr:EAL domain-containing protein [Candidatus Limnocylindrales bacterium]